ncbi:MAG: cytochrome P450 [Acidimicrobiia bacterium]
MPPQTQALNPFAAEVIEDPYPVYAALREQGVVFSPDAGAWMVSRFDDVRDVLRSHDRFSSELNGQRGTEDPELAAVAARGLRRVSVLSNADPPEHTWYRRLVAPRFTPNGLRGLHELIDGIVNHLIDDFVERGSCDLIEEFCVPFPAHVFGALMGTDPADIPLLRGWADDRSEALGWDAGLVTKPRMIELIESNLEMQSYLLTLIERVRREPRDDLLSLMVHGKIPGFGDRSLEDDELMSMLQILLDGGNETTINLLGSGTSLLLAEPEQLALLRDDPALIPNAVEEMLRVESPVQALFRTARHETEVGGVEVPAGAKLVVLYGSANRDERRWPDPARFDVRRADAKDGLQFGAGIHFCIGAHLARLEGKLAFEALLRRLPGLRLAEGVEQLRHRPSPILRSLVSLPVTWDAAA